MVGAAQCNAIAFRQAEVRLSVAMHRCVPAVADCDRDKRVVGNGDRPMRQRVRCDRHERKCRNLRRDDGAAGRKRVRRRARRRRDDDAISAHRIDEAAVDLDRAFDHRAERAAVDDDIV